MNVIDLLDATAEVAAPRLTPEGAQLAARQCTARLVGSPALEVRIHAISELSKLARTYPATASSALEAVLDCGRKQPDSVVVTGAVAEYLLQLIRFYDSDSEEMAAARLGACESILSITGSISYLFEGASLVLVNNTPSSMDSQSECLDVLQKIFTTPTTHDQLANALCGASVVPGLPQGYSLAPRLLILLQTKGTRGISLVDEILAIPGAMEGDIPLLIAVTRLGLFEALFEKIEVDRVTTQVSTSAASLLLQILAKYGCQILPQLREHFTARNLLARLGDNVHACAYTLLNNLSREAETTPVLYSVLLDCLRASPLLICDLEGQTLLTSKLFEYSLMLICTPGDLAFSQQSVVDIATAAADVVLVVIERSQDAGMTIARMAVLSLQPGAPSQSVNIIDRLLHLIGTLHGEAVRGLRERISAIVKACISLPPIARDLSASFVRAIIVMYRTTWKDGLRVIARSLRLGTPGAPNKSLETAQKLYREKVLSLSQTTSLNHSENVSTLFSNVCCALPPSRIPELVLSLLDILHLLMDDPEAGACVTLACMVKPASARDLPCPFIGQLLLMAPYVDAAQNSLLALLLRCITRLSPETFFTLCSLAFNSTSSSVAGVIGQLLGLLVVGAVEKVTEKLIAYLVLQVPANLLKTINLGPGLVDIDSIRDALRQAVKYSSESTETHVVAVLDGLEGVDWGERITTLSFSGTEAISPQGVSGATILTTETTNIVPTTKELSVSEIMTSDACTQTVLDVDEILRENLLLHEQLKVTEAKVEAMQLAIDAHPDMASPLQYPVQSLEANDEVFIGASGCSESFYSEGTVCSSHAVVIPAEHLTSQLCDGMNYLQAPETDGGEGDDPSYSALLSQQEPTAGTGPSKGPDVDAEGLETIVEQQPEVVAPIPEELALDQEPIPLVFDEITLPSTTKGRGRTGRHRNNAHYVRCPEAPPTE
ncbi:hypothetical protein GMRT_15066 [Giardia muris]|uniref:Uncharacterized protein n=1 Tax=Giardia muris TaxID=5742 RepID=A0A4Z1T306_GIAMU|nr:hypothetical protein GMRT_15066 [Giardia muris]|eukprot:TNJ26939.1 hypothetical protein GMRT_15066 [Giardia muris]